MRALRPGRKNLSPHAERSAKVRQTTAAIVPRAKRRRIMNVLPEPVAEHATPRGSQVSRKERLKTGRFLWSFYGEGRKTCRRRSNQVRRCNPLRIHTSPRSRTIEVATVRPSGFKLRPLTWLLAGGEGPKSRTTRRCPPVTGTETS